MIYPHEHLALDLSGVKGDLDCRLDEKEKVVREFCKLKSRGVDVVADLTNRGMGRDAVYADDVGRASGIKILHATGWYKEGFFPPEVYQSQSDIEALARIMKDEIENGMDGTGFRACVIGEIGTEKDRITPEEQNIFTAAARVQAQTGVPIVTHATLGRLGMEQIELLKKNGADISKVLISHVDLTNDVEYIMRLIDKGVLVGFDTIGKSAYLEDSHRVTMLNELSSRGLCGSVVLSMDITRRSHLEENGGVGYSYLPDVFLPQLNVSKQDIELMTGLNAERFYGNSI